MDSLIKHSQENLGTGIAALRVKDIEKRLNIILPKDFKDYLIRFNYAELYSDPIFGIHNDMPEIDLYSQNKEEEHFRYGFFHIFSNDIDGSIFLRPDTGAIYNASFSRPISKDFTGFVNLLLSQGS